MDKRYEFWKSRRQRSQIGAQLWHLNRHRPLAVTKAKITIPRFLKIASAENLGQVAKRLRRLGPEKASGPDEARFEAHTAMSTQALGSEAVRSGLKDVLLGPARLYEALREAAVDDRSTQS